MVYRIHKVAQAASEYDS